MKEDVLEQVVEDYLHHLGFFTRHNVKLKPDPAHPDYERVQDAVHSDVDVVGIHPSRTGPDLVWVVSCKAYQTGLSPEARLREFHAGTVRGRREVWRLHRELWQLKWGQALLDTIEDLTGQRRFRYFTAVTVLKPGNWRCWQQDEQITQCLEGNWVGFLRLQDMWHNLLASSTTTVSGSEIGRLAQMLIAAGMVATTLGDQRDDDLELTAPHLSDRWFWPSVAGMYCPPPPAATVDDLFRYGDTLEGHAFAEKRYGQPLETLAVDVAAGRPGPWTALPDIQESASSPASFERLRLLAFHQYRAWRFDGRDPDAAHTHALRGLHHDIEAAWAERRFERPASRTSR